jgi:hypothetical protein
LSKKGGHPLLEPLLQITAVRRTYAQEYQRLTRQRSWVIGLARLLDPERARRYHRTAREVKRRVNRFLCRLKWKTRRDAEDARVVAHIEKTVRHRWWGLFTCFRVSQLPATNNAHELFFKHLKQRQRRVTGRKSVEAFVLRYGPYAAYLDSRESFTDLFARLRQVDAMAFAEARRQVRAHQARLHRPYRFRRDPAKYLKELEAAWASAVQPSRSRRKRDSGF